MALATASGSISMPPRTLISASGAYGGCRSRTGSVITPAPPGAKSGLFIEHLASQLKILPHGTYGAAVAQQIRRVVRHDQGNAFVAEHAAAQVRDAVLAAHQGLRRELADGQQHLRPDLGQLRLQEVRAGGQLVRQRVAVLRRPALERV